MKLGNTREEMQRNYSEIVKKSRKVGKILALVGVVSSVVSLFRLMGLLNNNVPFGVEHMIWTLFIFISPISGYIGGHAYYYGFRRMAVMLEGLDGADDNGSGFLGIFLVLGGFGTMIAYVIFISLFQ